MPYRGARANYEIIEDEPTHLLLLDLGPWDQYKTITNAAEAVVEELAPVLNGRRLYYVDSEDQVDEIVHENGKFVRFSPGGPDAA